jgi:hypothetical protein
LGGHGVLYDGAGGFCKDCKWMKLTYSLMYALTSLENPQQIGTVNQATKKAAHETEF